MPATRTNRDRLMAKVRTSPTGCWDWTASKTHGYGMLWDNELGKVRHAHRVSYELHVGPIPVGLELDHLCRNRGCVNPEHLEPVTREVNQFRSPISPATVNAMKLFCKWGHEYTPANTYWRLRDGRQHRDCLACRNNRNRGIS